jgi:hypothetical protein
MMQASDQHFPKGAPRGRLRSHPLTCPLTGALVVGAACIGACVHASDAHGFFDCEIINRQAALRDRRGKPTAEGEPAAAIIAEEGARHNPAA